MASVRHPKMNQRTKSFIVRVCAALLIAVLISSIGAYVAKFGTELSTEHARWGEFGSYLSGVLGVALTAATLAIAVYATAHLPEYLDAQKAAADRVKTTVEMSRTLYDRGFYVSISAPAWEIAVKWLYWEGIEADEYRRRVCGGMFLYAYPNFSSPQEANDHPYQNLIRFGSHFLPYGHSREGSAVSPRYDGIVDQLSEHQVLVIWLQFWCNLYALLKAGLADEALVRTLFRDWYGSWLKFMLELRYVGGYLASVSGTDGSLRLGAAPQFDRLPQIEGLEKVLYQSSSDYVKLSNVARDRAKEIADRTIELHNAASLRGHADA